MELINGVNYTCSFKNNKKYNASKKPVAIIKGKGLYTGKKSVEFEIIKSIPDLSKGYELTVWDRAYSPKPGAYTTKISFKDPDGKKLKEGVDFDVLYMNTSNEALAKDHVVNVGETIVARITTKGGYTDNTFDKEFRIIGKGLDISKATVSVRSQIFKESVDGVRLPVDDETITVKINGQKLHRIEDGHFVDPAVEGELNGFSVIEDSYKDNHKCGTAGVMIRGVGIYGGIRTIRFTIKPKEVKGLDPSKKYIPAPDKYISVLDFGATAGDGTDDTGAIMNAISAASADTAVPPLFKAIHECSGTDWKEMYQVFNMGHRMEIYVRPEVAEKVITLSKSFNIDAQVVGHIEEGKKSLTIKSEFGEFNYGE